MLFAVPGLHKLHVLPHFFPCYFAAGQGLHSVWPFAAAWYPGVQHGHLSIDEPLSLFAVPGSHLIHDVWQSLGWIVPGSHKSHGFALK